MSYHQIVKEPVETVLGQNYESDFKCGFDRRGDSLDFLSLLTEIENR